MRADQADDGDSRPAAGAAGLPRETSADGRPDTDGPTGTDGQARRDGRADTDGRAGGADQAGPPADQKPGLDRGEAGSGEARPGSADPPDSHQDAGATRATRSARYRAIVDAAYRAHAIDQGYARVREIERQTVTPAMRRIEAEDPTRHLAGLQNRLKGQDRLTEKVAEAMTERARTADQAFATVKDAIRYTFCYPDAHYTEGVYTDCDRLENLGFERVDRRNSWRTEEYKGINSRWRVPGSGQLFEVQFHTQASLNAKEQTHWAYEKLRDKTTTKPEQEALSRYQRDVSSGIPIPPGALEIPDY